MNIGFLITARLKSSRLPLKLLKVIEGKTIIERVIERAKKLNGINHIVLCTSENVQDIPLIEIAQKNNIDYFKGDDDDVLKRLYDAAKHYKMDYFVGITGENPLFSIEYANKMINIAKLDQYDYIKIKGLPIGCATYGAKIKAVELVCRIKKIINTEIWGVLFEHPNIFEIAEISVSKSHYFPHLRITTDYVEDFLFISEIIKKLSGKNIYSFDNIINVIKDNPEILLINSNRKQEKFPEKMLQEINMYFRDNQLYIKEIKQKIFQQYIIQKKF